MSSRDKAPLPSVPYAGRPDPKRRETLWRRVERNRLLLVWYLVLFAVSGGAWFALQAAFLLGVVVFWLAYHGDDAGVSALIAFLGGTVPAALLRFWLVGLVIAVAYEVRALTLTEKRIAARLGAVFVQKGDLYDTKMMIKDMAIAAGMPVAPALYVLEGRGVNAFVVKAIGRRPAIGVTPSLLEKLSLYEQRAVFANLVARIASGDTLVATAVTGLLAPLETWRDRNLAAGEKRTLTRVGSREILPIGEDGELVRPVYPAEGGYMAFAVFSVAFVLLGEVAAAVHRRSQLRAAEKADAEGMLLLKDPASMLSALERCVIYDNNVSQAGPAFGELFYCWPGDSSNDEDDPEWERVARLREVLGVDGMVGDGTLGQSGEPVYPPAPRLEQS